MIIKPLKWHKDKTNKGYYFAYDGEFQTHQDDSKWFVDYILSDDANTDLEHDLYMKVPQIKSNTKFLKKKFGVSENEVMIFFYAWYNGSDEPIEWEN